MAAQFNSRRMLSNASSTGRRQQHRVEFESDRARKEDILLVTAKLIYWTFVEIVTQYEFTTKADIDLDGAVTLLDVAPFVDILLGN